MDLTKNDIFRIRRKKWFRLSNEEAKKRDLAPMTGEIILVNEKGQYIFNSYLYFTDVELQQMESLVS
jgi:hypothetical protein